MNTYPHSSKLLRPAPYGGYGATHAPASFCWTDFFDSLQVDPTAPAAEDDLEVPRRVFEGRQRLPHRIPEPHADVEPMMISTATPFLLGTLAMIAVGLSAVWLPETLQRSSRVARAFEPAMAVGDQPDRPSERLFGPVRGDLINSIRVASFAVPLPRLDLADRPHRLAALTVPVLASIAADVLAPPTATTTVALASQPTTTIEPTEAFPAELPASLPDAPSPVLPVQSPVRTNTVRSTLPARKEPPATVPVRLTRPNRPEVPKPETIKVATNADPKRPQPPAQKPRAAKPEPAKTEVAKADDGPTLLEVLFPLAALFKPEASVTAYSPN